VTGALQVFSDVGRNRWLRRLTVAYGAFIFTEYAVWIAVLVYAYRNGGATTAGVVAVVQLVPAALFVPIVSPLADRRSPVLLLLAGYGAQATVLAATGVAIFLDAPPVLVYGGAVVASTLMPTIRPAQAALVPSVIHEPKELTAANVVFGWVESLGISGAGAGVGLAMTFAGIAYVFVAGAVLLCAAFMLVLPLRMVTAHGVARSTERPGGLAGYSAVWRDPTTRLLVGLLGALYIVVGALDLLFVIMAFELLHASQAWAGYLNAWRVVLGASSSAPLRSFS
jgi:hypothetical protein